MKKLIPITELKEGDVIEFSKKKIFRAKQFAHISIQFTMVKGGGVDMRLTFNESPKFFGFAIESEMHGRTLANEAKCLQKEDHFFLESFCEAYLSERNLIKIKSSRKSERDT